ncbi:uncharacterized protein A4U43_C08F23290 [Asparagus officinalis]|uniref:probable apyrase 7 n=1 Tax=Asparagus officinalis TaxID=4686 RepID=UPI00098DFD26|nr:probable apyrase 7 [Asparagus officinalis]XP_020276857.1 probable apyrase 7 [Asparagus officinalis]XP_020276858.1 probable apyrase 7 [Asparagus officinalis]XP_020276859.1 probable apyrase 7 [Asparagus officinalis]XP_020276860.1 probable apyrase 7 [Asparagus officinalis]ONK60842.1 uncharacterized protein A4U43_C08F23290 [Asparagus officinalis]
MRLSASLQDFSRSAKSELREDGFDLEFNKGLHNKAFHVLQRDGGASSFSKEKSLSTPPSWKKWIRSGLIGLIAFLLLFILIYVSSRYYNDSLSHRASEYFVILDCGSTGTRVYVYEWSIVQSVDYRSLPFVLRSLPEGPEKKSTGHKGRAYQRMETEPGFSKLVHNESGLKAAVKPLLQWAEKQIPKHAHKHTSLFLYATAGVRRLPNSDSEWLMEKAWSILKKSSFLCQRNWVKVITGMEEAYYGWIALNYHMGMLSSSPAKETYGALDMGGSSLQVTFETENPINDETGINLSIGMVNHHLSAYSLSGYGLNDAFDKSVVHLLRRGTGSSSNGKVELKHPCLQTGYREEYICSQCGTSNQDGSPLVGGRASSNGRHGMPIDLIGTPHWEDCSTLAKATVNLSEWSNLGSGIDCELKPCALAENLPLPRGQFYAMSGFFVVYRFFNLTPDATLDDVLKVGREFCEKSWQVAEHSVVPQPFIEQYCFRAPYIVSLLRDGLHMTDSQVFIGSGSTTWTLGVALLEAGQAFSRKIEFPDYSILHASTNTAVLLVLLLMSVILLCCAISYAFNWTSKIYKRSYLPLFRHNSASPSILNFQRWSPTRDGRVKTPLSPTISDSIQHSFGMGGSNIQLTESSLNPLGFVHSFSSGSLGQMQFGNGLRGQTLQSRRSQSREDLSSSLVEAHIGKV